jgi:signal transduction histidine kinase
MLGKLIKKIAMPSNISTYLSRTLIIVTVVTTFIIGGVLIIFQTIHFNRISKQKSLEYINDQKKHIQEIVKNEHEYIRLQNEVFEQGINEKVRQNVNQAILTAESIYKKYAHQKSEDEIKALIITTISSLKFEMEYEEVFISTMDGIGVYYPRNPEFTGKNMSQFQDANGIPVILEEIKLLKTSNEGFLNYNIDEKDDSESTPGRKITFVKKFGHFNWYFGSKQYVDDYFPKFKEQIAQKISTVRFRYGGYIFMNQINGTPIVMDGNIYRGDLNMLTSTDDERRKVFLQQVNTVNTHPEGGFFDYRWNKIGEVAPSEKCSFVKLFKEYNWIIGAGFYVDEINEGIKEQQSVMRSDQREMILVIFVILMLLLVLEAVIIYHFNKKYKSDFDRFFKFFYLSQNSFNKLSISDFYFDEFKRAAVAANKMILLREEIEKKLIEEQKKATESDRLKSAFLANMSHEIRTPMNAILGFSELLEDDSQHETDRALFLKLIRRNGDILLSLINDIIDISKIEANLLTVRKRPVKLDKFLAEIDHHYKETIAAKKDKHIQFRVENHAHPDILLTTDEIRLRQILDNLIGNAIKFTASGSVSVEVKIDGELAHFCVSDTGIGIPFDQQAAIFKRFIQAEQGHKMNFGGTGLGLAISKNLIELLGGNIQVASEPGKGSTFYFHIEAN